VFGITGHASCLPYVFADQGDYGVIRQASFARTVVVHVIAQAQWALFHSFCDSRKIEHLKPRSDWTSKRQHIRPFV
jgi:hypothetical protein